MHFKKILVGIDFSKYAEIALQQALWIARKHGAEVVLVHAGSIPERAVGLPNSMKATVEEFTTILQTRFDEARKQLAELRERHDSESARVSHVAVDSLPVAGLIDAARDLCADLIVVGTHGRTGFERFMMGSVAERLVRHTPCSVLVARESPTRSGGYTSVLAPTDFSEAADKAVQVACELAEKDGVVEAFHCWQLSGPMEEYWNGSPATGGVIDVLREQTRKSAMEQGQGILQRHRERFPNLRFEQCGDTAARGIRQRAENQKCDLIVMGTHGRRWLGRWVLGSVSESTARYAPCSVLIVRPAQ